MSAAVMMPRVRVEAMNVMRTPKARAAAQAGQGGQFLARRIRRLPAADRKALEMRFRNACGIEFGGDLLIACQIVFGHVCGQYA